MEIIKCRFDISPVAMGEPDPCRKPLPRKSRYAREAHFAEMIFSVFSAWSLYRGKIK